MLLISFGVGTWVGPVCGNGDKDASDVGVPATGLDKAGLCMLGVPKDGLPAVGSLTWALSGLEVGP